MRGGLGGVFLAAVGAPVPARGHGRCQNHVEYAGIIPRIEQIAAGDPGRRPADRGIARRLGHSRARAAAGLHLRPQRPAAAFARARQVGLRILPRLGAPAATRACCSWAAAARSCSRDDGTSGPSPASASRCRSTKPADTRFRGAVRQKEFDYSLYEFVPPRAGAPATTDIDVGTQDDLHVLRFHAKETANGRSFRWSRDTSYVSLVDAASDVPRGHALDGRWRPPGRGAAVRT